MDLKHYAVWRKLADDDGLLAYVVHNEPVPVDVIEKSFGEYLSGLAENEQADALIEDYPRMLNDNVPISVHRNESTGGYDITGDIPDTLVEAISLVHGADAQQIVNALVDYNLKSVHGKECKIINTSLMDLVGHTRMSMASFPKIVPVGETEEDTGMSGGMDEFEDNTAFSEFLAQDAAGIPGSSQDFGTEDIHEGPSMDMEMPYAKAAGEGDGIGMEMPYESPEAGTDAGPSIQEMAQEEPETLPADSGPKGDTAFARAIRNIYEKFCADLVSYGLDKRLNLALG